jgi:hypothetical protein
MCTSHTQETVSSAYRVAQYLVTQQPQCKTRSFRPFADVQTESRRARGHVRLQAEFGVVSHEVLYGDQHLFVPLSAGPQFELAEPGQIKYSQDVNTNTNGERYPVLTWT